MSSIALCLALALQSAPTHSELHPVDADLFLEIPDIPALLASYPQAPLLQLLGDDELSQAIGDIMGMESFDLETQLSTVMATVIPTEEMQLAQSVRGISLSAKLPSSTDSGAPQPTLCLVVDFLAPEAAEAAQSALAGLAGTTQPHPSAAIAGAVSFQNPFAPGIPFWSAAIGSRLLVGGGGLTPDDLARRIGGEGQGLAVRPGFIESGKTMGSLDGPVVIQGFTSRSPLEALAQSGMIDQRLGDLGSLGLPIGGGSDPFGGEHRWRMQLVEDRFVTEVVGLQPEQESSAPSMLGGEDVEAGWLSCVPGDAMFVYASSFDGAALHRFVRPQLLSSGVGMEAEEAIVRLEESMGFSLETLFSHMGPSLVVYAESLRGPAIPETYIWIGLDDADAFQLESAKLMESLGENLSGFSLKTRDYRVRNKQLGERLTFPVTTLTLPPGLFEGPMMMLAPSPAFTVAGGQLLVSLSSMHLKRELKRLYGGATDDLSVPTSLLEAQNIAFPDHARSLIVMDWAGLINGIFSVARTLAPLAGDQLPFDIQALPDPELIAQYFAPTIHYSQQLENGQYRRHEASFGPETWLGGALAGGTIFGYTMPSPRIPTPAPSASPGARPDPPVRSEDDGQKLATQIALQTLRMGVTIHKLDLDVYPETLEILLQPTEAFPEGVIGEKTVPNDGWGQPFRYEPAPDGSSYRLWSVGANGVDESGEGDDVTGR
jgi:hypothetical protein